MRRDHLLVEHNDSNPLFVATVAAVLIAAGSVYVLRSRQKTAINELSSSSQMVPTTTTSPSPQPHVSPSEKSHATCSPPETNTEQQQQQQRAVAEEDDSAREPKQSRSKERRRRGKDPFKELLKAGKKNNKIVAKLEKSSVAEQDANRISPSPSPEQSHLAERDVSQNSRSSSLAPSSRSANSAEAKPDMAEVLIASSSTQSSSSDCESRSPDGSEPPAVPAPVPVENLPNQDADQPSFGSSLTSGSDFNLPNDEDGKEASSSSALGTPDVTQSPSASVPESISSAFGSVLPSSHSLFPFEVNEPPIITTSHTMPPYYSSYSSTAVTPSSPVKLSTDTRRQHPPPAQKFNGSWDWEGQGSSNHEITYQKPPRFRSKSRVSSSSSLSGLSTSVSYGMSFTSVASPSPTAACFPSSPPPTLVTSHTTPNAETSRSFTFPSLNSPPLSQAPAPYSNGYVNSSPVAGSNGSGVQRRTTAPQGPSTPMSGVSDSATTPSSSDQPQVNVLKGALEAARMREDKFRQEAEHYAKEYETLRWRWAEDSAVWRRKEAELQHQIHHLMHQLQAYNAAYMSNPTLSRLQISAMNQSYLPHQFPPSPSQHPLSPTMQMLSPNGQSSPSQQTRTPSPFFAYQPQSPTQSQSQSQHQSNLLSLLFPGNSSPTKASSARPSSTSVSGSSSVDSLSPQLDASPTRDRGRQCMRVFSRDKDWVVSATDDESSEQSDTAEGGGDGDEVSELLAGAILKHPESLRARSKAAREQKLSPKTEFTFPTISLNDAANGRTAEGKEDDAAAFWNGGTSPETRSAAAAAYIGDTELNQDVFREDTPA